MGKVNNKQKSILENIIFLLYRNYLIESMNQDLEIIKDHDKTYLNLVKAWLEVFYLALNGYLGNPYD